MQYTTSGLLQQNYKGEKMYKLTGTNSVKRLADGACIPFADGNRDYEEYKQWIADGNTPEPEFTEEELRAKFENEFRQNRDSLLSTAVDHYQKPLVWETLTDEQQDKVRVYRQALLDSTNNWILPEELVL